MKNRILIYAATALVLSLQSFIAANDVKRTSELSISNDQNWSYWAAQYKSADAGNFIGAEYHAWPERCGFSGLCIVEGRVAENMAWTITGLSIDPRARTITGTQR